MSKAAWIFEQSNAEYVGRLAGVGYAVVEIGTTSWTRSDSNYPSLLPHQVHQVLSIPILKEGARQALKLNRG